MRSGKTLLLRLCSVDASSTQDLYSKADALFIGRVDPDSCAEEMLTADEAGNFYIVWLLLKEGPCSKVDLKDIRFFEALRYGLFPKYYLYITKEFCQPGAAWSTTTT